MAGHLARYLPGVVAWRVCALLRLRVAPVVANNGD